MIETYQFGTECKKLGFHFFTGVPCSFLNPLINFAINECEYITAVNEGEAVSIAAGAAIGGKKSVVLMQNSGLTNASSPLTSLIFPFRIPILGFVSLRGAAGLNDEPQHELMGRITAEWLTSMNIHWEYLSDRMEEALQQLNKANAFIDKNEPFFFIVKKGTLAKTELQKQTVKTTNNAVKLSKSTADEFPARIDALKVIQSHADQETVVLATTGKTGRELYQLKDASNQLYMVGSMGCVPSLALGICLARKEKDVIAIDGDGAILMRLGSLATNGYNSPPNLLHILLDNQTHDSTGGQQTVSHNVQFVDIAAACGYHRAVYVHSLSELDGYIQEWKSSKKLTFLHLKIAHGSLKELGRPSIKPFEVKERLQVFLND
ncbi:phosphonopyruvate decarboxylase [Bacillus benzoevorans]|uniref:Phosphonopyruvate decarboxylase n=1 Tax=Bacillus benzoevorans TaxID=1456 RepID=A0A7X0HR55_9BACI|nr:phosphonopyruvate decarboxylase [Bacillus benzoevorans]MBB6445383.1 phosphonopyruvate decarboxylase [Bacillus benzoevorans]